MKDKSLGGYQALIKMMQWPWSLCAEEESSRTHYDWCCTVCKNLGNEKKCGHTGVRRSYHVVSF